ncbi:MAG: T9SS type A sorting domain-containing protein [Candidatus Kapabacteria bacterium]|nr:T9SS type A sorting domain-containing protein [Candidatus Kapabacteria bacterium]
MLARILTLLLVVVFLPQLCQAQVPPEVAKALLSVNTTLGKDFWIAIPPNEVNPFPTNELEVYVASAFDTEITVFDASGDKYYKRQVKANEIRTLSDSRGETNWTWEIREYEQPVRKGVRITSKEPICVYVINSKTTTSDGYLAVPVSAWNTSYLHCSYYDFREARAWAGGFVVLAAEDNTVVTIALRGTGELDAKTAGGRSIGSPSFDVVLNAGEVYMVKGDATTRGVFDLTGSAITADKPIGLLSFHERTTMPNLLVNGNGRNHLVEMMYPTSSWGKKYSTIEFNREHLNGQGRGDVFRVIASEPNTRWSFKYCDLTTKEVIGIGGGVLARAGDFADLSQEGAPRHLPNGYSVWSADKPIQVMQYSCSSSWDGDPILDPFMIRLTPVDQFVTGTFFEFPTSAKWGKHRLNVIAKVDTSSPTYLDDLKSLQIDGIPVHQYPDPLASRIIQNTIGDGYHWASVDFGPSAAAHTISGNGNVTFGGYIYGYGQFDAYGWPLGGSTKEMGSIDTMPPIISRGTELPTSYSFAVTELRNGGSTSGGTSQIEKGLAVIDTVAGAGSFNFRLVGPDPKTMHRYYRLTSAQYKWEVIDPTKDARCVYFAQDWADNRVVDSVTYRTTTSVSEGSLSADITVTPNPTTDLAYISWPAGDAPSMVCITDMQGRSLKCDESPTDGLSKLSVSDLVAGRYIVTVTGHRGTKSAVLTVFR